MAEPTFSKQPPVVRLVDLAAFAKAELVDASRGDQQITGIASLDEAGPMHLAFFDNHKYANQLASTKAAACLVSERFEAGVPSHVAVVRARRPFHAFVAIARHLDRQFTELALERLATAAVTRVANGIGDRLVLVVTEMLGHFGIERLLHEQLGQLLQKAVLADQIFRLLVVGQQRGQQLLGYFLLACSHGVSGSDGSFLPRARLHKI